MELEELKNMWTEYDRKLDRSLELNMQLMRRMNFDKAGFKLKSLFVYRLLEAIIFIVAMIWLTGYVIRYFNSPRFGIPAVILDLASIAGFISVVRQFFFMVKLQMWDYSEPVTPWLRKLEKLKVMLLDHMRYSYFLIPMYPLILILFGKAILNFDFLAREHLNYLICNVVIGVCLIPVVIIFFLKLRITRINAVTEKALLQGSGWFQIKSAEAFLHEIEKFEREEGAEEK